MPPPTFMAKKGSDFIYVTRDNAGITFTEQNKETIAASIVGSTASIHAVEPGSIHELSSTRATLRLSSYLELHH